MILDTLRRGAPFQQALERIRNGESPNLSGLTTTAKAFTLALLARELKRTLLVIVDGNKQAEELSEPLETFLASGDETTILPALDVLPHQGLSPHSDILERRAVGLMNLAAGRYSVVIAPIASALLKTRDAKFYGQLSLILRINEDVPMDLLAGHLESVGYTRSEPVQLRGEYSIRGGIVDVFAPESERPVRIEFFGDTIDSMREFDPESQRSVAPISEAVLRPLVEEPGFDFFEPERPRNHSLPDLAPGALVIWDEPEQTRSAAERFWKRLEEGLDLAERNYLRMGELESHLSGRPAIALRELGLEGGSIEFHARPTASYQGNLPRATADIRAFAEAGGEIVFYAPAIGELERLQDLFKDFRAQFVTGTIGRGVLLEDPALALYSFDDLFDTSAIVVRQPRIQSNLKAFASDVADLKPGDYVVHTVHGIGKFVGIKEIPQGDTSGDFMVLEYAGDSKLYVPLTRLDLIQKFRGAGDATPPLDRMGGATWERTKTKVRAKMRDMADELLKLYAERKMAEGFAFSPDSNWQREFEDSFEYPPTRDQLTAVADIKRDMESQQPMDRLLCGDVGFGKTEVAMRAAFKALGDGRQVAVLAPTTVLAFQHFETFKRRFASFPARIDLLSRFRSPKELKQTIADLETGKVDVVIGTHRILSKDVEFRDLGLLIVDEEQRFGVRHKERLKQLRRNVDVLTMSATPIPRTLHMSLLGIRDMSVIETPPKDRLAIHTVVAHFDLNLAKAAIEQEIQRGGQVYFIHNRVESIYARAASIQEKLPDLRIGVGHGQLGEAELERVLLGFMRHEFDVFVSTTIVENGIDIPLANTIIIESAQNYGLSELYQLRGRVGRSNRRAYAYLLVPSDTELSEIARKRLAALKEFSDLGAGFKIAALDLELRGAGNILGGEQHGHITDVGFDMYVRMLEETVRELKGEEIPPEVHSTLNLGLEIRIPTEYIGDDHQRLRAYKRVADLKNRDQGNRLLEEFTDRYGPPPNAVKTLVEFSLVKALAESLGVESVDRRGGFANLKFHKESRIDPQRLFDLVQTTAGAQFSPAGVLRVPLAEDVLQSMASTLRQLANSV